jgi:hypothetical protein
MVRDGSSHGLTTTRGLEWVGHTGYSLRRPDADLFFSVVSMLSGRVTHSFERAKRCYDEASDHGEVRTQTDPGARAGGIGGVCVYVNVYVRTCGRCCWCTGGNGRAVDERLCVCDG